MKLTCISTENPYRPWVYFSELSLYQNYECEVKDEIYTKVYFDDWEWNLFPSVLFSNKLNG